MRAAGDRLKLVLSRTARQGRLTPGGYAILERKTVFQRQNPVFRAFVSLLFFLFCKIRRLKTYESGTPENRHFERRKDMPHQIKFFRRFTTTLISGMQPPAWMTSGIAVALFNACAAAQTTSPGAGENINGSPPGLTPPRDEVVVTTSLNYSWVGEGRVSFPGVAGNSGAQSVNFNALGEIPINGQWFVPFGLDSHNLFLGSIAGAPIPDQIHALGLNAGLGYRFNDQWTLSGTIGPRIFQFDDFAGDDLGLGGTIRAVYRMRPTLALAVGINFETGRQPPVLPAAGLRWNIRTNLMLTLMWPRSALIYRMDDKLDLFAGGGGDFTAFRTGQNFGSDIGQPAFNNAVATCRDFRVGVGAQYHLWNGVSVEAQGGYSFAREIDYKDIGQAVSFGNSPYVQVGLTCRF